MGSNSVGKQMFFHEHFLMLNFCSHQTFSDHFVVHYGLTQISCYLLEQQLELWGNSKIKMRFRSDE